MRTIYTGLGNPNKPILDNNIKFNKKLKKFADDFIDNFKLIKKYNGFNYSLYNNQFRLGIEPMYMYDELEIICFDLENKGNCWWRKGIAFGAYGSRVVSTYRFYGDYKRKSKFVKFIDKWYDIISNIYKR